MKKEESEIKCNRTVSQKWCLEAALAQAPTRSLKRSLPNEEHGNHPKKKILIEDNVTFIEKSLANIF